MAGNVYRKWLLFLGYLLAYPYYNFSGGIRVKQEDMNAKHIVNFAQWERLVERHKEQASKMFNVTSNEEAYLDYLDMLIKSDLNNMYPQGWEI